MTGSRANRHPRSSARRAVLGLLFLLALAGSVRAGGEEVPANERDPDRIAEEREAKRERYEALKEERAAAQRELEAMLPAAPEAVPGWTDAATGRLPSAGAVLPAASTSAPAPAARSDAPATTPHAGPSHERQNRLLVGVGALLVLAVTLRAFVVRLGARRRAVPAPAPSTMTLALPRIEDRKLGSRRTR